MPRVKSSRKRKADKSAASTKKKKEEESQAVQDAVVSLLEADKHTEQEQQRPVSTTGSNTFTMSDMPAWMSEKGTNVKDDLGTWRQEQESKRELERERWAQERIERHARRESAKLELEGDRALRCGFCHLGTEVESICGKLHYDNKSIAAHRKCMQYSADLVQYKFSSFGGFKIDEVEKEIRRGERLKCSICKSDKSRHGKIQGATAGCAISKCSKTFHYYCARLDDVTITRRMEIRYLKENSKVVIYRVFCGTAHYDMFKGTKANLLSKKTSSKSCLPLEKIKCVKHPSGTLSQFCVPCETALCEMCITTSSDHKKHDVRDVEKLFREIHQRKDGGALLMCLLLCKNYKINLEEEQWMGKYNAVAEVFKFNKIKKQSALTKINEYKPVLKQDGPRVTFSCGFLKHKSFLEFAKDRTFVDMFLTLAEKENIAEYCRSSAYPKKEGEIFCWLRPQQTEQLIERLGEDIFMHPTWEDTSIHEAVFRNLGIPMQVIMRGDDSVKNFLEHLKKGKTTMYHATGMLIGCAGSGKTTLLGRLKGIDLDDILNKTRSTRGIDIQTDIFDVSDQIRVNSSHQKQRFKVRIDDEPPDWLDGDIDSNESKEIPCEMSDDSMDIETESMKGNEASAAVLEKAEERVVGSQTVAENLESLGIIRVSKQATGEPEKKISMVDFAGQCSYYSSHQIFLSPRAFFILVLNMEKKFDEMVGEEVCCQKRSMYKGWTHRDYLTFWVKNIHQYSSEKAPILLVGTHAEEKTDQEKAKFFRDIWKALKTKTKSLQGHLEKKRVFAIGFHENENIEKIKESIVNVIQKLDHWGEMLPHSWAMFENFFQEKKYLRIINKRILLAFNEALPKDIKLETVNDMNTMLQFFHDIREILYFNQEFLREVIILDVQWFADAFKNVITDKNHAKEDLREFTSEWDKFDDTGELSDTLLCRIWKMNNNEYLEHKDDIILYMEKLGLLAKMDDKNWYVPCMNKKAFPISAFSSHPASSVLCYTFDVLPAGIFHRLVATCMQNTSKMFSFEDRGCIYQTAAKLMYHDRHHNILMGMTQTEIQLQVFVVEGEVDVSTCHQIRERIESVLHDLSNTFQDNSEFHVAFKCKPAGFCDSRKSAVLSESEFSRATFQCPSCKEEKIHIVNTRDITKYWKKEQQQGNLDKDGKLLSPVDSLERRPTDKELMTVSGLIGNIFLIGVVL